jgi:hypothetical protein
MTKTYLTTLSFVAVFLLVAPSAKADSYGGPYCFEKPVAVATDDSAHLRGTCKTIEFKRLVSLDDSLPTYRFVLQPMENPYTEEPTPSIATTSRAVVEDGTSSLFVQLTLPNNPAAGPLVAVETMASEDPYGWYDSAYGTTHTSTAYVDQSGKSSIYPYSQGVNCKFCVGTYVPVTSPVTKVIEYWHIAKKPNGFMLVKDNVETYLDDGSMKVTMNHPTSATASSTDPVEEDASWWSRFIGFFKNLF